MAEEGIKVVVAGPPSGVAKVKIGGSKGTYKLAPGEYILTSGSVTLEVLPQGRAEVEFLVGGALIVVVVDDGGTVTFDERIVEGEIQELIVAVVDGDVTVNDATVPPGQSLTILSFASTSSPVVIPIALTMMVMASSRWRS